MPRATVAFLAVVFVPLISCAGAAATATRSPTIPTPSAVRPPAAPVPSPATVASPTAPAPIPASPTAAGSVAPTPTSGGAVVQPSGSSPAVPPGAQALIDLARRELAGRAGVAESAISLVRAEAVEWGDASLGCPQPGQMYAQVITPGFRIVLRSGGTDYHYHGDARGRVVYCQNPPRP